MWGFITYIDNHTAFVGIPSFYWFDSGARAMKQVITYHFARVFLGD
jgi:hypothetical protein